MPDDLSALLKVAAGDTDGVDDLADVRLRAAAYRRRRAGARVAVLLLPVVLIGGVALSVRELAADGEVEFAGPTPSASPAPPSPSVTASSSPESAVVDPLPVPPSPSPPPSPAASPVPSASASAVVVTPEPGGDPVLVAPATVTAGSPIEVGGSGFRPGADVAVALYPQDRAGPAGGEVVVLTADGAGDLPATRRSPREPGVHVLSASYPDAADPGVAVVSTTIEVTAPAQAPAGLLVDGVAVTVVSACTQNGTYVAVDDDQGRTFGVRSDNVGDGDPRLFLRTGQDPGASTAEVTIQRDGPRTTWAATLTLPDGDDIDVALTADPDALPTCNH